MLPNFFNRCKTNMAQGKYFPSMYVRITADGYSVTVDDGCAMRDTHVHMYVDIIT